MDVPKLPRNYALQFSKKHDEKRACAKFQK